MGTFSLSVPAEPKSLLQVRSELQAWLRQAGIPGELSFAVVSAASEATSNAVEHADNPRTRIVELEAELYGDLLTVRVRDHGSWREPRLESGRNRGLLLISGLMTHVEVDRSTAGTTVTMQLDLAARRAPQA
jgi:serine/threonine-protein kinase RsbW